VRWTLTGRAQSSNGRKLFTVVFSFAPAPTTLPGYAVWKLRRAAMNLRATTTDAGTSAELVADGKRVRPALVIAPSRRLQNKALDDLLRADMRHLEAVADGEISGACAFYSVTAANATDAGCAQAIGLTGKRAEIEKSIAAARIESYNGYTLARTILGGQPIGWVLDRGHFRFIQTNLAN
jgi:hypothetical protein